MMKLLTLLLFTLGTCEAQLSNETDLLSQINTMYSDKGEPVICSNTFSSSQECTKKSVAVNEDTETLSNQDHRNFGASMSVPFPKMPDKIRALILRDWNALDPKGEEMLAEFKKIDAALEFAHARTTFYEHLQGTFSILSAWNQPEVVRRTGLVHTAYSGDLFQFYLFDATSTEDRAKLRDILGSPAEALTHLFGTIHRGNLCNFSEVTSQRMTMATPPTGPQTVHHRVTGEWTVSPQEAANILMVTIADYLDQMVETNGWRDHHQIEDGASVLYPGSGKPAIALYWFSSVCFAIKDVLDVVPPIFNNCTEILTVQNEERARDSYWNVIQHEASLTEEQQVVLLHDSIAHNPYVAEPHIMLSQIFFRQQLYHKAAVEARAALEKLYVLASAWDKRRAFEYWVGYGRILLLRANRKLEEKSCHLPCADEHNPIYTNYNELHLTPLRDMMVEMKEREEK